MRSLPVLSVLLMFGVPALAQTPASSTTGVVALQRSNSAGCPVGFEARHAQQGAVVSVRHGQAHPEQTYRLTFLPNTDRKIVAAKVTLHGLAGGALIPAGTAGKAAGAEAAAHGVESAESFNLSPTSGADHLFRSTVYTEKLTGVQWIELNELRYANGVQWHESAGAVCRITPNGYMLVAAGQ